MINKKEHAELVERAEKATLQMKEKRLEQEKFADAVFDSENKREEAGRRVKLKKAFVQYFGGRNGKFSCVVAFINFKM